MKPENPDPKDTQFSALLREARVAPSLPPRFREGVWRRIEEGEAPGGPRVGWLEALAAWALRPRLALAAAVVLICAGSVIGAVRGTQANHQEAQSRYVTSVAPNSLR